MIQALLVKRSAPRSIAQLFAMGRGSICAIELPTEWRIVNIIQL